MKVGFILECALAGPDAEIYPYVAKKLCPNVEIAKPETLKNKQNVINEGALVAATLLATGCDYVFIVWDRMPKWGGTGKCADHIAHIDAELDKEKVNKERVFLCCINEMLESWMIADGRGITRWINTKTPHTIPDFGDCKDAASQSAPKDRIKAYLREHYNKWKYNDYEDNFDIIKHLPDFERAGRWNASFNEFKKAIEQICQQS
jgi:hypothetical protein